MKKITLKGVRQNNLKNIDIEIPIGSFVVICGPSGSGKSSLAFQTLFAEGQRRYLESLSNYARQFVGQAPKPLLDSAQNIPPAIALEQRNSIRSSRSTVGTHTDIYDYIRTFYAKVGTPFCPNHNTEMKKFDASTATTDVLNKLSNQKIYITCPVKWKTTNDLAELRNKTLKLGFYKMLELDDKKNILNVLDLEFDEPKAKKNDYHIIIDRLLVEEDSELRIFDGLSQSFELSGTLFGIKESSVVSTEQSSLLFKGKISCSQCEEDFWDLSPDLFSFNNVAGACTECRGFGNKLELDENKIIPNKNLSIKEHAIHIYSMPSAKSQRTQLLKFCKKKKININTPWKDLPKEHKELLWRGEKKRHCIEGFFTYLETKKYKMHVRVFLNRFKSSKRCSRCEGFRLNPKINQVKINGTSIGGLCSLPLSDFLIWLKAIQLDENTLTLTKDLRSQITDRITFLNNIGLSYLSLSRETKTLSGGEFQRLNISNQLGSDLSDTLYVLDEPTIGLHPRDNTKLIELLKKLHANKNTVVIVEHDKEVIESGEYIFEIGPGSGKHGGGVIFSGTSKEFLKSKTSLTASFLNGERQTFKLRPHLKKISSDIQISGCTGHNLKNVDLNLPSEKIVCITGVSGSGKSSLITQSLYPAVLEKLTGEHQPDSLPFKKVKFPKECKSIDFIDQKRVSKSKRSFVATYLKIFDSVRKTLSNTVESKISGFTPGTFSLNTEGGRCPQCKGLGIEEVDMLFMDNISLLCDLCLGKKYTPDILKIKYNGKNVSEILDLTCTEAIDFFTTEVSALKPLKVLEELGLGYLRLGQSLDTLSGGESQRLKLSRYLLTSNLKGRILIFDEPSSGLHFKEIQLLLAVFDKLTQAGASVLIIEHNLDLIASSDWVVDIGPEAGAGGGNITTSGHPLDISKSKTYTGKYLKIHISNT